MPTKNKAALLCLILFLIAGIIHAQTAPRAILLWDAINDLRLVNYRVLRGISETTLAPLNPTTTETNFLDETLEPTIKYWYGVAGIDNEGDEGDIGLAENNPFRFSDVQPASPANVICTKTKQGNTMRLNCSWGVVTKTRSLLLILPPTGITYRCFLANTGVIQTLSSEGTSIQISSVPRHRTFYFYVTSIWNGIESLGSPAIRIQT